MRYPGDRGGRSVDPNSIWHRSKACGINPWTVYNRIKAGWEVEAALTTPVKKRSINVAAEARKNGLDPGVVYKRIHQSKWPISMALTRPKQPRRKSVARHAV
ncbi:MAG TPA: hypothetical protein VHA37_01850 [Candidatus Saccharimonadales bacterium]|nr:hypothetical protein [Candidatus Saccharimonadales bacterium]